MTSLPSPFWKILLVAGAGTALVFTLWPGLDLYAASLFYLGDGRFAFSGDPYGEFFRTLFIGMFTTFCAIIIGGLAYSIGKKQKLWGFSVRHWLFLITCTIVGPGIVTNSLLKDHWGRARPSQIVEFGSKAPFTPALLPANSCKRNCSFVSGESSSIFMMFFALALLVPLWRAYLLAAGLLFGSLAGLIRMGMGGHFLSDVIFSGIFMLAVAGLLYWLFFERDARKA